MPSCSVGTDGLDDQSVQGIEYLVPADVLARADGLGRIQTEGTGEDWR
ncbi:hypothetical protein [Streptomyces sp. NPDC047042]